MNKETFVAFRAELRALCEKYGVYITSSRYDTLQVWKLEIERSEAELAEFIDGLEDRTK